MAPADLGTDSGNGAAVPALPMHTDPVSIAVRPRSSTHLHADVSAPWLDMQKRVYMVRKSQRNQWACS